MKYLSISLAAAGIAVSMSSAHAQTLVDQWLEGEIGPNPIPIEYEGNPVTVRLSLFLSPEAPISKVAERAFERLKKDSEGKLIIRPFWNNTLANAAEGGFDAVSSGVADISSCYTFMNPGGFTLQLGLQIPFLIERSSVGSRAIAEAYPEYFIEKYEARGVYFARSTVTPPNQVLTIDAPVKSLADFSGKRMWAVGEVPTAVAEALGAAPVPLAPAELYTSFQTGVLDIVPMHDAGTMTFRLNELADHRTATNLSVNPTEYCMNRAFFDGLPADLQAVLYRWLQLWNHAEAELYYDDLAAEGREIMQEEGVEFHELSDEELERFRDAIQPVEDAWVERMEAQGEPGGEFLENFRAIYAELDTMSDDEIFQQIMDEPVEGLISGYDYPY